MHAFVNDLERRVGTYLYGRRLYEVMLAWETLELGEQPPYIREYAEMWRAAEKIVYSRSLEIAPSARTRIERAFEPEAVLELKRRSGRDLSVGGADLAGQALRAGLVDELHLFVAPIVVGGGTRALPAAARLELDLVDERGFSGGFVHLHYRTR